MSFKIEQWRRVELAGLAALVLILFAIYLKTMSPAFPANDSPETISAASELGIQHPPGYPLHTLLGRITVVSLPLGSPAWRMNCLSALLAVLAALVAALLTRNLAPGLGFFAPLSSFMALGLWRSFWEQATEAKGGIYLLNLALCLALLAAFFEFLRNSSKVAARMFVLLSGLALANHYMSAVLFIAPCAAMMLWKERGTFRHAVWALPGLTLYLLLPLRAHFEPFNNLGDPSNLERFFWVLLRRGYTQADLSNDWGGMLDQLRLWAINSMAFGAFWVAPAGILGLAWLWKQRRAQAMLLAAIYALVFVAVILLNRTAADVRWLADIFILPGSAVLALASGIGLMATWGRHGVWLGMGLLLFLALRNFAPLNRSQDFVAYDYGANTFASLPQNAIYAADGDFHFMPLLYQQQVLGRRKDTELLVSTMLGEPSYQARLFKRRGLKAGGRDPQSALQSLSRQAPLWLSSWHPSIEEKNMAPLRLWQRGLTVLAAQDSGPDMGASTAWVIRQDFRIQPEPLQESLWPWYAVALVNAGNQFDNLGRYSEAARAYATALGMPGKKPRAQLLFNLGQAHERSGRPGEAVVAYERALGADSSLELARQKLQALAAENALWKQKLAEADAFAARGDASRALPLYDRAAKKGFESPSLWRNVGVLKFQRGDFKGADQAFVRALALGQGDVLLYKYRIMSLQKIAGKEALAQFVGQAFQATGDAELKELLNRLRQP